MPPESPQLPPKPEVALALLQTAASVYVHLDPRADDVMVPSWFKTQPQLVLQIGLNMTVPIPDLDVGRDSISCTLSFNRRPEFCRIPWTAIYGLVGEDGRGMIWPESVPAEVASAAQGRSNKRPQLRVAEESAPAADASPAVRSPAARSSAAAAGGKTPKTRANKNARGSAGHVDAKRGSGGHTPARAGSSTPAASTPARPAASALPSSNEEKSRTHAPGTGRSGNSATQGAGRRKELPPYLRVVK